MMASLAESWIDLAEIAQIELFILKRMREFASGDHASVFEGTGFNFAGLKDWEPGDAISSIDWAQSSLNNFSPMATRDYEQNNTATIVAVADASLSTRCGANGTLIMSAIARSLATLGLSAVMFQDTFGLVTFDDVFRRLATVMPRIGKPHVVHCLHTYQHARDSDSVMGCGDVIKAIVAHLRKTSLVPVISDFLFTDVARVIRELAILNIAHDVFLMMVDARFAFEFPDVSAGWLEVYDVETERTRTVSRREMSRLASHVEEWQEKTVLLARDAGLDIVRVGLERWQMESTLMELVAARRLRKLKVA
jgi:uncharacterized protein (DUF58 family)